MINKKSLSLLPITAGSYGLAGGFTDKMTFTSVIF